MTEKSQSAISNNSDSDSSAVFGPVAKRPLLLLEHDSDSDDDDSDATIDLTADTCTVTSFQEYQPEWSSPPSSSTTPSTLNSYCKQV